MRESGGKNRNRDPSQDYAAAMRHAAAGETAHQAVLTGVTLTMQPAAFKLTLLLGPPNSTKVHGERRSVAMDETTREVSERQVMPPTACARESSNRGR
jgi:hypothetical protein